MRNTLTINIFIIIFILPYTSLAQQQHLTDQQIRAWVNRKVNIKKNKLALSSNDLTAIRGIFTSRGQELKALSIDEAGFLRALDSVKWLADNDVQTYINNSDVKRRTLATKEVEKMSKIITITDTQKEALISAHMTFRERREEIVEENEGDWNNAWSSNQDAMKAATDGYEEEKLEILGDAKYDALSRKIANKNAKAAIDNEMRDYANEMLMNTNQKAELRALVTKKNEAIEYFKCIHKTKSDKRVRNMKIEGVNREYNQLISQYFVDNSIQSK